MEQYTNANIMKKKKKQKKMMTIMMIQKLKNYLINQKMQMIVNQC